MVLVHLELFPEKINVFHKLGDNSTTTVMFRISVVQQNKTIVHEHNIWIIMNSPVPIIIYNNIICMHKINI